MKKRIRFLIALFLYYSGLLRFLRYLYKKNHRNGRLFVLMYHRVVDRDYGSCALSVSRGNFLKQIRYLTRHYRPISMDTLHQYVSSRTLPKEDSVVITFDDGYEDNYTNAYPVLNKFKAPAIMFLTSGHIGNNKIFWWDRLWRMAKMMFNKQISIDLPADIYPPNIKSTIANLCNCNATQGKKLVNSLIALLKTVTEEEKNRILDDLERKLSHLLKDAPVHPPTLKWEEVRAMSMGGMDFGSHTVTHPIMTRISPGQSKEEILRSKQEIESHIGKQVMHFSYPNGHTTDFNDEIKNNLRGAGFITACSTLSGTNDLETDLFALKRTYIANVKVCEFACELSGIYDWFPKLLSSNSILRPRH